MITVPAHKQVVHLWWLVCAASSIFVGELDRGRPGLSRGDRGATATEYALMVSLIAVVIIAAVSQFGKTIIPLFNVPSSALTGH